MRCFNAGWLMLSLGFSACDGASDPSESPCEPLCEDLAECRKVCDPEEGPTCDEGRKYAESLSRCRSECAPGVRDREGCEDAAEAFARCAGAAVCDTIDSVCTTSSTRYEEWCFQAPGALTCPLFCAELSTGCLPYARFGFRGEGCEATCRAGVETPACAEAHYTLAARLPARGFACTPPGDVVDAEIERVVAACAPWETVTPDPEEVAFCEAAAADQCRCGLFATEDECPRQATARCLFALGFGPACRTATEAFSACMSTVDACNRDTLRDRCGTPWTRWTAACEAPAG